MARPGDVDEDLAAITGEWLRDTVTPAAPDVPVEQRFLMQLRDAPEDLAMRMVFADWLEERGQPNKALVVRLLADPPAEGTPAMRELRIASAYLDGEWLAIVSRVPIARCAVYRLDCPGRWDALLTTDDPFVRGCGECQRSVHFCATLAEVRRQGIADNCVALSSALPATALVEYDVPQGRVAIDLGDADSDRYVQPLVMPPDD
jgi:uncharacterized protein (TIGR02996 family)